MAQLLLTAALTVACSSCSTDAAQSPTADAGSDDATVDAPMDHATPIDHAVPDAPPADAADAAKDATDAGDGEASADDGGLGGPAPKWEVIGEYGGMRYEHLANPSQLRAFRWTGKPAPGVPGSDNAEFLNLKLMGTEHKIGYNGTASEYEGKVRLAMQVRTTGMFSLFTDTQGHVLEAIRCYDLAEKKWGFANYPTVRGDIFATSCLGWHDTETGDYHGVVGTFGKPASTYKMFYRPRITGLGPTSMGSYMSVTSTRFAARYSPHRAMVSFSLQAPNDPPVIMDDASQATGVWEMSNLHSIGEYFLWDRFASLGPGGSFSATVRYSNGTGPGKPLVTPPAGAYDGTLEDLGDSIAWMRAYHITAENTFDRIELWASKFDGDITHLQPHKVADLPGQTHLQARAMGSWGHYVYGAGTYKDGYWVIWDIEHNTQQKIPLDRKTVPAASPLRGGTKTHVFIFAKDDPLEPPHILFRFPYK